MKNNNYKNILYYYFSKFQNPQILCVLKNKIFLEMKNKKCLKLKIFKAYKVKSKFHQILMQFIFS